MGAGNVEVVSAIASANHSQDEGVSSSGGQGSPNPLPAN